MTAFVVLEAPLGNLEQLLQTIGERARGIARVDADEALRLTGVWRLERDGVETPLSRGLLNDGRLALDPPAAPTWAPGDLVLGDIAPSAPPATGPFARLRNALGGS